MSDSPVVAILRYERLFCHRCLTEAVEREAWDNPVLSAKLMAENQISVVRASELKGHEKCAVCGARIK